MPGESQQVLGAAYASIKPDLKRLCATHRLDIAWVEQSGDCEQLLGRVLGELDRLLHEPPLGADDCERLQGLIQFCAGATSLHEKAASSAATRHRLEELERENRELRSTIAGGESLPLIAGDAQRDERLAETFRKLASLTHKINNPLTSLIGRTQLMRLTAENPERTLKAMNVIEESSRRVADYVRELALVVKESRERELSGD